MATIFAQKGEKKARIPQKMTCIDKQLTGKLEKRRIMIYKRKQINKTKKKMIVCPYLNSITSL